MIGLWGLAAGGSGEPDGGTVMDVRRITFARPNMRSKIWFAVVGVFDCGFRRCRGSRLGAPVTGTLVGGFRRYRCNGFGLSGPGSDCIAAPGSRGQLESLILAQNERWRQA